MKDKLKEFFELIVIILVIFLIFFSPIILFTSLYNSLSKYYYYKYVYEYKDLDGNIGISDNCTYYKDYGYHSQSDNQVCYINNVKTLVKTIEIYGVKKCYSDSNCESYIYTDLHSLLDYNGESYNISSIKK